MFSGHKQSNYNLEQTIIVLQTIRTEYPGHLNKHLQFIVTTYMDMVLSATCSHRVLLLLTYLGFLPNHLSPTLLPFSHTERI